MDNLKAGIKAEAKSLGFSFLGIAEPKKTPHFNNFLDWILKGNYAGLYYLAKDYVINGRRNPEKLVTGAKSVIVAGVHYQPQISFNELPFLAKKKMKLIAGYAALPDYHPYLRKLFKGLVQRIEALIGRPITSKLFIDSGPVMEKDFAHQAGLGWIGKNSLLITPNYGSYCLIGCLFTDVLLPPDKPLVGDVCKDCQICIQACPKGCIGPDRTINVSDCISYQTTVKKESTLVNKKSNKQEWVFGCDICQLVCPVNRRIVENKSIIPAALPVDPLISQQFFTGDIDHLNSSEFERSFKGTPVQKIGLTSFLDNLGKN